MSLLDLLRGSQASGRPSTALSQVSDPATDEMLDPTFRLYGFRGEQMDFATDEEHCWCPDHAPAWNGQSEARVLVHVRARESFGHYANVYKARTGKTLDAALYLPIGRKKLPSDSAYFGTIVREDDVEALWKFRDGEAYNPATLPAPGEVITHAQAIEMAQVAEEIAATLLSSLRGDSRRFSIGRQPGSATVGDALGLAALLGLFGDEPVDPDSRDYRFSR